MAVLNPAALLPGFCVNAEGGFMKDLQKSCKIAVVQAAPVLFDKKSLFGKGSGTH